MWPDHGAQHRKQFHHTPSPIHSPHTSRPSLTAARFLQGVVVSPPAELQLNPAAAPAQDTLGVHDSLSVMVPDTLGIDGIAARLADSRSPRDLYDLLAELRAHTSASAQDFERFVRRNVPVLAQLHNAGGAGAVGDGATEDFSGLSRDGKVRVVAQLASQERQESAVWQSFLSSTSLRKERVLSWSNKPSGLDPLLTSLAGHSDSVSSIAISPDGKRVITGSSDHLVKIWEVETGALVSSLFVVSRAVFECVQGGLLAMSGDHADGALRCFGRL